MSQLSPQEQEAIKDAPKGTYALMLLLAVLLAAGWAFMFFSNAIRSNVSSSENLVVTAGITPVHFILIMF